MDKAQCLCRAEAFLHGNLVLASGGNIIICINGRKLHIGIAQLLTLVNKGRAAQGKEHHGERFGCQLLILYRLWKKVIDGAALIVIFKKHRIPAHRSSCPLTVIECLLQITKLPFGRMAPHFLVPHAQHGVTEFEQHAEYAMLAYPVPKFLRLYAVGLADREDIMPVKDPAAEFPQKVQDARRIGCHFMYIHCAVCRIRPAVSKNCRLFDIRNGIDAEAANALVKPEVGCRIKRLAHLRVLPVQIRLLFGKGVQIILSCHLVQCPGRAAEDAAPVGRCCAIRFRIAPDIPVAFCIRTVFSGFLEPGMLIGGMIEYEIHHNADIPLLRLSNEPVHVLHCPVGRVDTAVICNIVPIVHHRGFVYRGKPYSTHP